MTDWIAKGFRQMQPGVHHRVAQSGEKAMLCEVPITKGSVVDTHAHPHEQICYIVSGRVEFTLEQAKVVLSAGESLLLKGNASHGVVALADSFILDIFSPPREDFLQ